MTTGLEFSYGPIDYGMGAAFHPANCECHYAGINPDCPNTIWYEAAPSIEPGFGAGAYLLGGGNASIKFDLNYYLEQLFG